MAPEANETVLAVSGSIAVAPVGTAAPADAVAALSASFTELGYTTEDGVTFTVSPTIEDFRAWQSRRPIRREKTQEDFSLAFVLQQWNKDTVPLAFGGGTVTQVSAGPPPVYKYEFPADDDALDERMLVLTFNDGDKHYRYVFPRGNVGDAVETNLQRGALALLPITFTVLSGAPVILTDDPAFDPA